MTACDARRQLPNEIAPSVSRKAIRIDLLQLCSFHSIKGNPGVEFKEKLFHVRVEQLNLIRVLVTSILREIVRELER